MCRGREEEREEEKEEEKEEEREKEREREREEEREGIKVVWIFMGKKKVTYPGKRSRIQLQTVQSNHLLHHCQWRSFAPVVQRTRLYPTLQWSPG